MQDARGRLQHPRGTAIAEGFPIGGHQCLHRFPRETLAIDLPLGGDDGRQVLEVRDPFHRGAWDRGGIEDVDDRDA